MSRLIKIYPKGWPCIPMFRESGRETTGEIPKCRGGVICLFVAVCDKSTFDESLRRDKWAINQCLHADAARSTYIQVIYQDMIGWVLLSHIDELYTIELDSQGEPKEKLVYRSQDDEQD